jgi:hypothetical protein
MGVERVRELKRHGFGGAGARVLKSRCRSEAVVCTDAVLRAGRTGSIGKARGGRAW